MTATTVPTEPATELILDGRPEPLRDYLASVWAARGLVETLARKDFFVRYRRASLGVLWAVGLPLVQAAVITLVFSHIVRVRVSSPFGAFVLAGILPWAYFSQTVVTGSTSIVEGSRLASRIYFPRAVLPIIGVVANFYSLVISLVILVAVSLFLHVHLGIALLMLAPALLLVATLAAALSLVTSALHVYFRDMRFVVQAIFTVWFYVTPVIYPLSYGSIPAKLREALFFNPMTGVVEMFRASTVGADAGWETSLLTTAVVVAVLCVAAVWLHRRYDRLFTDLL